MQRGVKLAQLLNRLEETGDIGEKGHQHAEGQAAIADNKSAAKPEHNARGKHAQKLDRWQEEKGERHGRHVGISVDAVDLVKRSWVAFFLRKGLDHLHASDVFCQIAHDGGNAAARLAKGNLGAAARRAA